jgi:hypothetical protein
VLLEYAKASFEGIKQDPVARSTRWLRRSDEPGDRKLRCAAELIKRQHVKRPGIRGPGG